MGVLAFALWSSACWIDVLARLGEMLLSGRFIYLRIKRADEVAIVGCEQIDQHQPHLRAFLGVYISIR
jgi:hypothetical protein